MGIEYSNFDVWEIFADEKNEIKYQNEKVHTNSNYQMYFFGFDEIRFIGEQQKLKTFYQEIWRGRLSDFSLIPINENVKSYPVSGLYDSGSSYDVGVESAKQRAREVLKNEFIEPSGEFCALNDCIFNDFFIQNLREALVRIDRDGLNSNLYSGLEKIEFRWNNRVVNTSERTIVNNNRTWHHKNADWWDNCLNPEWIKYKTKREITF